MRPIHFSAFFFTVLASGAPFMAAEGPEALSHRIVSAIDAPIAPCPVETHDYLPSRVVTCLEATIGASEFKDLVDRTVADFRGTAGGQPTPRGEWLPTDLSLRRFLDFPETTLFVEYLTRSKRIVVSYPKPLPYRDATDAADPTSVPAGLEKPRLIEKSHPPLRYPALAQPMRIDATIALRVVVQKDGTLRDVCVVPTRWKGQLGFEYAAFESVKSWRFTPARRAGEPVEASTTVRVRFRP